MNLVVLSHKETWANPVSPCGYSTVGGFPFQMQAISNLFDQTTLMLPIQSSSMPAGSIPLTGHNICVIPLAEPHGLGWKRKLSLISWTVHHCSLIWKEISCSDAVHVPVPGDVGSIGLFMALLQRKPLFIRHCGTWGNPSSRVDWFLQCLLEIIAGGRNVVMATGGADRPPSKKNPNISWIFSTSLSIHELDQPTKAEPWDGCGILRLVTVGRLAQSKNIQSLLRALPTIRNQIPALALDIVGDGEHRNVLEKLVLELDLGDLVRFHGNLSHGAVMKVLSQSHLFVFPSLREGFPKALLEALACGLPVVASSVSVIPELLNNGAGLLLKEPTLSSIAQAVLAITSDLTQMARMSSLASQAASGYTLEAWSDFIGQKLRTAWEVNLCERS